MQNPIWVGMGIFVVLGLIVIQSLMNRHKYIKKLKTRIKEVWAKKPPQIKEEKLKSIATYFEDFFKEKDSKPHYEMVAAQGKENGNQKTESRCEALSKTLKNKNHIIDEISWNDLNMDVIYNDLNSTCSTVGEEYLYAILRTPTFEKELLKNRESLIRFFSNNVAVRQEVQLILSMLGKVEDVNISNYFSQSEIKISRKKYIINLLAVLNLISTAIMVVNLPIGLMLFILSFTVNLSVYYRTKNLLSAELESISYIVKLISSASKILKIKNPEIMGIQLSLSEAYNKLKGIRKKTFSLLYSNGDVFIEYAKIIYMRELADYESIMTIIQKNRAELQTVYEIVGLIDSMIAVASYRERFQEWCNPIFQFKEKKILAFENGYHPLIGNPVKNSIELDKSIIITGSNASGKSTFIKTMGINAIFAQTINTCLAKRYESSFFKVYTSMALRDDLMKKESYYIAELKSLKRILDAMEKDQPILCFVDEVLRGTNTIERIAASSQILYHFSISNCVAVTATHDLELTSILGSSFDNYHFHETITDTGVEFDYKIYPDKSTTRNAIKLLKFMGYPTKIVENSEGFAEKFIKDSKWGKIEESSRFIIKDSMINYEEDII